MNQTTDYREISIEEILNYTSNRNPLGEIVISSDEKPMYPLIATPIACWYNIGGSLDSGVNEVNDDELFIRLKRLKPHIRDTERIIGITKAKELLFKEEYITEDIRREMDEWDRIDD